VKQMTRKLLALTIAAAALLGACGGSSDDPGAADSQNPDAATLQAAIASYDLAVGPPRRFLVGLQLGDARLIGFGTIKVRVRPEASGSGAYSDASFLAVPGGRLPAEIPDQPSIVGAATGRGVYATEVTLSEPGLWTAEVEADVDGLGTLTAQTTFQVNTKHAAIAVGDKAPASKNPTMTAHGKLPFSAIDSRADSAATVPDPDLHEVVIADALAAKRPMVISISTPVYCVSKFCGPITDMVDTVAKEKAAQADFIHVEVWGDYDKQKFNAATIEWIGLTPPNISEPWVYVVGSDGIVKARFDNVVTEEELRAAIDEYAK
jgi:hypothetical protein